MSDETITTYTLAELVEEPGPGFYLLKGQEKGESQYWLYVRKPDGTYWHVEKESFLPLRLELGAQVLDPKQLAFAEERYLALRPGIELRKLEQKVFNLLIREAKDFLLSQGYQLRCDSEQADAVTNILDAEGNDTLLTLATDQGVATGFRPVNPVFTSRRYVLAMIELNGERLMLTRGTDYLLKISLKIDSKEPIKVIFPQDVPTVFSKNTYTVRFEYPAGTEYTAQVQVDSGTIVYAWDTKPTK